MKGPNPFTLLATMQKELAGRKSEKEVFNSFLKDISAKQAVPLMVVGMHGVGKSAMLAFFAYKAEKQGFYAINVRIREREGNADLLKRIRAQLMNYLEGKVADGSLSARVMKNIMEKKGIEEAARAIGRHAEGLILLMDDVDKLKDRESLFSEIAAMQKKNIRVGFIFSSKSEEEPFECIRISLKPFDEHEAHEMIEKDLGKGPPTMGKGCFDAILKDSEGNPKVLRMICHILYDRLGEKEKIITRRHYIVNSSAIMSMLERDVFDKLWGQVPQSEKDVLHAFAKERGPSHISDVARQLKMRHATTLALRLVERGQLIRVDRGVYRVYTWLYGEYVLRRG
jgi:hypothetical protein